MTRLLQVSVLAVVTLVAATQTSAQELTLDPATGDYTLRYYSNELGRQVAIRIEPPNKINPALTLRSISTDGSAYTFTYELANHAGARSYQAIDALELVCPTKESARISAPTGWVGKIGPPLPRSGQRPRCEFGAVTRAAMVPPGGSLNSFVVTSGWLPAIRDALAWGAAPPVQFPSEEQWEHDPDVHNAIASVSGVTGGWVSIAAVAPAYDPTLSTPQLILSSVQGDLEKACGSLGWITNGGVCNSLQVKLQHAAEAYTARESRLAQSHLLSFLSELDAQHGPEPGKHVSENVYWLLRIDVEYVRSRL